MERGTLGILVFSGLLYFAFPLYDRQFHFINDMKTWPEAQTYCREQHTDLATVSDLVDLMELTGLVDLGIQGVFVGLYRGWGWSLSYADDYKEGEVAYWNWAGGQPVTGLTFCGNTGATGEWFANNCDFSLNFFCYQGSATNISERFTLVNISMNWSAAQVYCRNLSTDLARVRNQLENEQLQRMATDGNAWIGLTGLVWMWSDGSQPSYLPWKPLEPLYAGGADCGVFAFTNNIFLGMRDVDCNSKLPFFCYSVPLRKHLVRQELTAKDPSLNMKDPAVMESILRKVEEKLGDKGVFVKLSWSKLIIKNEI